jgi:hypothetical protein
MTTTEKKECRAGVIVEKPSGGMAISETIICIWPLLSHIFLAVFFVPAVYNYMSTITV